MINFTKYTHLNGIEEDIRQIFNKSVQGDYDVNDFMQWNCCNHDSRLYTEQSRAVAAVIRDSVKICTFLKNPYSKGLAITINYRNCTHSSNEQLLANDYEAPLRQIIHVFKESLMHHSRLICLGCFEVDGHNLVHCHFVLDGKPLRETDDRKTYGYYKTIQFLTCKILPDTDQSTDICVKKTRDLGFLRYSLKSLKEISSDKGLKVDTSPLFYNPIPRPKKLKNSSISV